MDTAVLSARPQPATPVASASADTAFDGFSLELQAMAARIDRGDAGAAAALSLLLARLQTHPDPRCTGLVVFGSALAQRLSGALALQANLYLRRFDVPQIQLFNLLGRCVPMAALATQVANEAIAQAIQGQAHATVLDIGIGTGRQVAVLLDMLAATDRLPARMTVIGVEPGADALAAAAESLAQTGALHGVDLQFHGFAACSENLSQAVWQMLRSLCAPRPVVNAAFALHHIADDAQGHDQRNRVLGRLRELDPTCIVLSEPDVDHLEPRLLPRFQNCFRHFGAVFAMLDALPLQQAERDALKVGFFGREIGDILGTAEPLRTERHESTEAWLQRLAASGFEVQPAPACLPASSHPVVAAVARGDRVTLTASDESVVSVLVATPRRAAAA